MATPPINLTHISFPPITFAANVTPAAQQAVQQAFALKQVRNVPAGGPPTAAGAEELAAILSTVPGTVPGVVATPILEAWGENAIKSLEIVAGSGEVGFAGEATSAPPVVRVKNGEDDPFPNVLVHFAVSGGGGTIQEGEALTAQSTPTANALAKPGQWILGDKGDNTLTALADNLVVIFTATAVTNLVAFPETSTEQTGEHSKPAGKTPTVLATDHAGRTVEGAKVKFKIVKGGGNFDPPGGGAPVTSLDVTTKPDGTADCNKWNLGAIGENTVEVTGGPFTMTFKADAV